MKLAISQQLLRENDTVVASPKERNLLNLIRKRATVLRSEISALADLPQQTSHRILDQLARRKLVHVGDPVPQGRGQPSPILSLNPDAVFSVGITVNTDSATILITNFACKVIAERTIETQPCSMKSTLSKLKKILEECLKNKGVARENVIGIGFAIAGYFLEKRKVINAPEPLKDWSLEPIDMMLEDHFNLPVWLENNATTGAIGESLVGAGLIHNTFGYLAFNYGFGGGLILEGKPFFGHYGNAGEFSTIYSPDRIDDRPALNSLVIELNKAGYPISNITELNRNLDVTWPEVDVWIDRVTPQLNEIIHALMAIIDPEAIVFGGELPVPLGKRLMKSVTFWQEGRYGLPPPRPLLKHGLISQDSSALGAALIPLKYCYFE